MTITRQERIAYFKEKYGETHYDFACIAAVPLVLSPDLLYKLWRNFKTYRPANDSNQQRSISHIAVSDLLMSSLCSPVGYQLYKIEDQARHELAAQVNLTTKQQIARFLQEYALQNSSELDKHISQIHLQTAKSILEPEEFAQGIAKTLKDTNQSNNQKINTLNLWIALRPQETTQQGKGLAITQAKQGKQYDLELALPENLKRELHLEELKNEQNVVQDRVMNTAQNLIAQAKVEGRKRLDLGNCGLEGILPEELFDPYFIENLTWLSLGERFIDTETKQYTFSSNTGNLNRFTGAELDLNKLSLLKNLRHLYIAYYARKGELQTITFLNSCNTLQVVGLWGNKISNMTTLPSLPNLIELHIAYNHIEQLGEFICLPNLEILDLANNCLVNIEHLGQLSRLKHLDISTNNISNLNPISHLFLHDTNVKFENNPIQTPPPDIVKRGMQGIRLYFETEQLVAEYNKKIAKSLSLQEAKSLFDEMKQAGLRPNEISYSTLINKSEKFSDAKLFFDEMKQAGLKPNEISYSTLINKSEKLSDAKLFFDEMKQAGLKPNEISYSTLINKSEKFSDAKLFFEEMKAAGLRPDEISYNILFNKITTFKDAKLFFDEMKAAGIVPNEIFYNTLINKSEKFSDAKLFFDEMKQAGLQPDEISYSTLINRTPDWATAKPYYEEFLQQFPLRRGNSRSEKNYNYLFTALFKKVRSRAEWDFVQSEIYRLQFHLDNYVQRHYDALAQRWSINTPNPPTMPQKLNIFISYAHKDEDFKEALDTHLTMLKRSDKVNTWNDRAISAGTEWDAEIKQQLQDAHIIILLVSASFLASDYIWKEEISHAMQRHEARTARIIPVFIKPCDWKDAPFAKIQGLPRDAKPVGSAANDEAWAQVAQGIRIVVDDLLAKGVGVTSSSNANIVPPPPPPQNPTLKELIAQGKIAEVLQALPNADDLVLLKSRFNRNENDHHKGIISLQDYRLELARITQALLSTTAELGLLDKQPDSPTHQQLKHNEINITGDNNIVIQGSDNNNTTINNIQNPPTQQNQSSVIQQAITLVIQQNFAQAFTLLNTLHLQNPLYYQLKKEYTSGVYRNDFNYADRLITFLRTP